MSGWVYVFEAPHAVKIGVTSGSPERRARDVQNASGMRVTVAEAFRCDRMEDAGRLESRAHRALEGHRIYGEWFTLPAEAAVAAVREIAGLGASLWTRPAAPEPEPLRRRGRPLAASPRPLRDLRLTRGWTLADLAQASGLHVATISQLERGRMAATAREIRALSDAIGLQLATIAMVVHWERPA